MDPNVVMTIPQLDLTGIDFGGVLSVLMDLIPKLLPVTIGFVALRKGISFIYSSLRGA